MMGHDSRAIAVYHLVVDECEAATEEFQSAARNYQKFVNTSRSTSRNISGGEPIDLRYFLHVGLLTGDDEFISDAAGRTLAIPSTYVDQHPDALYHYYYVVALAAELENTGTQEVYLGRLDEAINEINSKYVEDALHVLYKSKWRVLSGIVSRDNQKFTEGLADLLDHQQFSAADSLNPKDLVCLPGAALTVLARREGMDVYADSEFIPECVYELA